MRQNSDSASFGGDGNWYVDYVLHCFGFPFFSHSIRFYFYWSLVAIWVVIEFHLRQLLVIPSREHLLYILHY
jgi:hypothetical protein